MKYVIMSGKFETGNDEQQQGYMMLFGPENIQYFFDLYFHWYNLVHEMGHCIVEKQGAEFSKVDEEMYVNSLAVAYYRFMGEEEKLGQLKERLTNILNQVPAPMPEGEDFVSFYTRIWNTDAINNVMIYGYFQLRSVLEALKNEKDLDAVLKEIGVEIKASENLEKCAAEIKSDNAALFLDTARKNLISLGVEVPEIRLELVENPMIQCAREE
ncbi:MAG: hypothetical protein J6Y58_10560 [Clostridiales bacterium]|nr:hypothetical protein [Clostridiales bacterium]